MVEESQVSTSSWELVVPEVDPNAEFREIASDFGDPLEIVREAVSNAYDANATELQIAFEMKEVDGSPTLVIEFKDNGDGMTGDVIKKAFWGLGISTSRGDDSKIGEKGHGTKIFLKSQRIELVTHTVNEGWEAVCKRPQADLYQGRLHSPEVRQIPHDNHAKGTLIRIWGYNDNERSRFTNNVVFDYLNWFTKFGSIEGLIDPARVRPFVIRLKCLDDNDYIERQAGHRFPEESPKIEVLFERHGETAGDYFVKRYKFLGERLDDFPDISFDIVISVEGDHAKRIDNPLIRDRQSKGRGTYKVADRYGLWLCKDFIPVEQVNSWVTGFGTGSNSITLLHAFVNCQKLKLTANRGSVANTSPVIQVALREAIAKRLNEVDKDLRDGGIFQLFLWEHEARSSAQEQSDFSSRTKRLKGRKSATLDDIILWQPTNESEFFGLFMVVYSLHPELFAFEPIDYNTNRGIDLIARSKSPNQVVDVPYCYVELKFLLRDVLNHGFKHLRYIVCWDFDKSITDDSRFKALSESVPRKLVHEQLDSGETLYFLDSPQNAHKVQVIRLRELLEQKLNFRF